VQTIRSLSDLAARANTDPAFAARIANNPAATLTDVAAGAQLPDTWVYRLVVSVLGLVALTCAVGAIVIQLRGIAVPDILVALGSAAVGALAGLLAPSPAGRG
jgi:hypothetical protein